MERNIVIHGDQLVELKKIPDETVDLIFADLPYWLRLDGDKLYRPNGTEFDGCDDDWDNQFNTIHWKIMNSLQQSG